MKILTNLVYAILIIIMLSSCMAQGISKAQQQDVIPTPLINNTNKEVKIK